MSVLQTIKREVNAVLLTTAYFAAFFLGLMVLKDLVLEEYRIKIGGISLALVGALVAAKVVLVLEHIPLGTWIERQPGWVDVAVRTLLYGVGVGIVMLLEKAFESRHEHGGFGASLGQVLNHAEIHHVWAATIGVTGSLLVFNAFAVLRRSVGDGELRRMYFHPREPGAKRGH